MTTNKLLIHGIIIKNTREAYLTQITSQHGNLKRLRQFCGSLVEWSRPELEWSRPTRVVAPDQILHCGRGLEWSRPSQVVAHPARVVAHQANTPTCRKSPPSTSQLCLLALKCIMRLLRGRIGLYMPKFEKINLTNPLCNVLTLAFTLTLFLSSFCPEVSFLRRLTPFFLQVDHLMDSGEGTRVVAGIFENF